MELSLLSVDLLLFLFLAAMLAGFIDTLAGGGGLITVPSLMLAGLPPLQVLATNKLQGSFGTGMATWLLAHKEKIRWKQIRGLMLVAFLGSAAGTIFLQFISADKLAMVIPIVLLAIMLYFLFHKPGRTSTGVKKLSLKTYTFFIIPGIGFYDGMFGPGTGSFFSASGMVCRGKSILKATALAKPLNFATNVSSLLVFIISGQIVWLAGVVMIFGQMIGAWFGTHYLFKIRVELLKSIVVLICTLMLLRYCYSQGWFELIQSH
jgi:uncharacterized membrane protein YfcA